MVANSLSDKLHVYSLLSAMTGRMKKVTGHHIERFDAPEHFHSKAIRLLRGNLQALALVPQQTIIENFFLSTLEAYHKNYEGARAHFLMIRYLVDGMGGFHDVDLLIREMCFNIDAYVAGATVSRPIFEIPFDPGPMSTERQLIVRQHISCGKQRSMGHFFLNSPGLLTRYA
jgi:hypothetical protein